jgi:copper(I)-binding protein
MLHRGVIFVLSVLAVTGLSGRTALAGPPSCGLEQSRLTIPVGPPGVQVHAAYGQLVNSSGRPVSIAKFESPPFGAVELHESFVHEGVASMREIKNLEVGPHQAVKLEAGAKHLMLMQPRAQPEAGLKIPLEIVGTDGCVSKVEMTVQGTTR